MAMNTAFIKKWNGKTLQDDGCYVSSEFNAFQNEFLNAMRKIAISLGGDVVNTSKGHYDVSGFINRGDKYVYFNYDNCLSPRGRTYIALKDNGNQGCFSPLLIRTAKDASDYRGGRNNISTFERCHILIERLLA